MFVILVIHLLKTPYDQPGLIPRNRPIQSKLDSVNPFRGESPQLLFGGGSVVKLQVPLASNASSSLSIAAIHSRLFLA